MNVVSALFSILMPGTGQMYNKQFIKGLVFMFIEHWDNVSGHLNKAIFLDLNGFHKGALEVVDFAYAPFYAGFYVYAVWDSWYHASENRNEFCAILFVIGGFLGEFATLYARFLPYPAVETGSAMIIPMLIGMIIFRKPKRLL